MTKRLRDDFEVPQWDLPGWDWAPGDYTWLDTGIHHDGTDIFFIHGGRIRHQSHIPQGLYSIEDFCRKLRELAVGLDEPSIQWHADTGEGSAGVWVEGTRAPNESDLLRLQSARDRQRRNDEREARILRQRRPDLFEGQA